MKDSPKTEQMRIPPKPTTYSDEADHPSEKLGRLGSPRFESGRLAPECPRILLAFRLPKPARPVDLVSLSGGLPFSWFGHHQFSTPLSAEPEDTGAEGVSRPELQ